MPVIGNNIEGKKFVVIEELDIPSGRADSFNCDAIKFGITFFVIVGNGDAPSGDCGGNEIALAQSDIASLKIFNGW